jgi:hypothetical protein
VSNGRYYDGVVIMRTPRNRVKKRNRTRRMKGGVVPDADMGYHLYADVLHDFPGYNGQLYNIGGAINAQHGEDVLVSYFTSGAGLRNVDNGNSRLASRIIFTLTEKTDTYQTSSVPVLYPGGNMGVGIVQDAGHNITEELGAKNVLTFGSILDPAGKPIKREQRPIWFRPNNNRMVIPLKEFGFDPDVIQSVTVGDLTAGTVAATFNFRGGISLDAVTRRPARTPLKGKPINNTKVDDAGFFTSISGANIQAIEAGGNNRAYLYNIGKTLGDVMLVASAMPNIGGIENPYVRGPGEWLDWTNQQRVVPPQILMLKTGDRLNHIRAFIKNVPTILEQQAKAGRNSAIQYEFIPTRVSEEDLENIVSAGYEKIVRDVQTRYNSLIKSLRDCSQNGMLLIGRSTFTGEDVVRTEQGRKNATILINVVCEKLEILRDIVIRRFRVIYDITATVAERFQEYNRDDELSNRLIPTTIMVFNERKKTMNADVIVTRRTLVNETITPIPAVSIRLWNAFKIMDSIPANTDVMERVSNTDIGKFFAKLNNLPVQAGGGLGVPTEDDFIKEFVNNIAGDVPPKPVEITGGVKENRNTYPDIVVDHIFKELDDLGEIATDAPVINEFCQYMKGKLIKNRIDQLRYVYSVIEHMDSNLVSDMTLAESLSSEFQNLRGVRVVQRNQDITRPNPDISTPAALLYNAFASYINKENSASMGAFQPEDRSDTNENYVYFSNLEVASLSKLREFQRNLRTKTVPLWAGRRTRRNKNKK